MAPTPSAGKATGAPKTPTKLGRKPQSSQTPKLGQPSGSSSSSSAPKPAQDLGKKASDTAAETTGKAAGAAQGAKDAAKGAQGKAQSTADDAKSTVEDAPEGGADPIELKDDEDDEDDGPLSKVTEAKDDATEKASGATDDLKKNAEEASQDVQDTADDATEKAGEVGESTAGEDDDEDDVAESGKKVAGDAKDSAGGVLKGAQGLAGKAQGLAGKTAKDPSNVADDAKDTAEEGVEDVKDTAEGATGDAEKVAGDAGEAAEDATGDVEDAAGDAGEAAEGATGEAGDVADDVGDEAEGAADGKLPDISSLPLDYSVLEGLEVQEDGIVQGPDGPIGKLVEGDAEDLAGYPISKDGEILDDDGDLVGRVELLPEAVKQQLKELKEKGELPEEAEGYLDQIPDTDDVEDAAPQLPGLDILNGLTCDPTGLIFDDEGNTVGQVTDGDPQELMNATLNENGEFINEEGEVIGHAEVHPEAADLYDGVEDQLPGVEALEGRELNDAGEIVGTDGEILGQLEGEDADALKEKLESGELKAEDLQINDEGQVVDAEGNVLGTVGLAEGAAEKLKDEVKLDIRILEGKKVNRKGKILDSEGEIIGEVKEGEIEKLAGKKVSAGGKILDKDGNEIGSVDVVPGEAAEAATRELLEELDELPEDAGDAADAAEDGPKFKIANLDVLEGLKVNKKGQVLNEDGDVVAELVEGELSECAGKKLNSRGEIVNESGDIIGRVKAIPQELTEEELASGDFEGTLVDADGNPIDTEDIKDAAKEGAEEAVDEAAEDSGVELPPLSDLEGLTVNKAGNLIGPDGSVYGVLYEGDAKKLSKSKAECDADGNFWDGKGHIIGKAKTVAREDAEEEAPFAGLEGLVVVKGGLVEDEGGNSVGRVVEGDASKLVGRSVDEDGDILDKKGSVVGRAERLTEEEEPEAEAVDLSSLKGKVLTKQGLIIDDDIPVARLVEGNVKELAGKKVGDENGQFWSESGKVLGRVEMIPEDERETKAEGIFAGLENLKVSEDGYIITEDGTRVGIVVEGDKRRLIGMSCDEDGEITTKHGEVRGRADRLPEEEEEAPLDTSILNGLKLNKQGYVVTADGQPVGKLVEGNVKELAGRKVSDDGKIYNDTGKPVGRCEVLPEDERPSKPEGIFAGLGELKLSKDGYVVTTEDERVGILVEGDKKKLHGKPVDADGDITDSNGNTLGRCEPYEEEEETPDDLSSLEGCTVNKAGNIVDSSGTIRGRVAEGDIKNLIGKKVDGKGQIWSADGKVVGRAELAKGQDTSPEGPFAGFEDAVINKEGLVVTPAGDTIGRVVEGDVKRLVNHKPDESGDILDKNGNVIGKVERWEPEQKEKKVSPMSGRKVNKEGEVRSEDGEIIGRLTQGDLGHCVGCEIDDAANVIDSEGNKIGEVTLLENIVEEDNEELTEEQRIREEERQVAEKMANICQQTLERIQPVCKQITEHIEKADRTPREELDEDELVNNVKPLIEEGSRILQECNGSLRGLDPDGHIAAQAKGRSGTKEASPEEHRLAETLKELTTTVVTTIDNAKKRINDMPHAKKKLNPLWGLLTQPLFQILAAVGLLLAGVLGLVGQILSGLGLGGLVNGLLGGLGIDKLLGGLGIGGLMGGDDKKKKGKGGGMSSLPLVGGLMGGK